MIEMEEVKDKIEKCSKWKKEKHPYSLYILGTLLIFSFKVILLK